MRAHPAADRGASADTDSASLTIDTDQIMAQSGLLIDRTSASRRINDKSYATSKLKQIHRRLETADVSFDAGQYDVSINDGTKQARLLNRLTRAESKLFDRRFQCRVF